MKSPYEPPKAAPSRNQDTIEKINSNNAREIGKKRIIIIASLLLIPFLALIAKLLITVK